MLGWSQTDMANASGVSEPTIKRLESSDGELGGRADTGSKIVSSLEAAGVIFIAENGEGPGVRLRKSAETTSELTKQIDAISAELAETDHNAPASPAKGMQQLEDAHKANKVVKLKNKRTKIEKK